MEARLHELADAVPASVLEAPDRDRSLQSLLEELATRRVPTGRIHRAWSLGTLTARIAAGWGVTFLRGAFAGADERERLENERRLRAALLVFGRMGYLRGAVLKVGQLVSCYPKLVPDELADTLTKLHFEAPPMHYALLAESVRKELGQDPEEVFASFEREAFAAASLGQVHRATARSGEPLAVKVQYPGIARTIESDFRNLSLLSAPMRLGADGDNLAAQLAYVRDMLLLESDYGSEAHFLELAHAALADMDGVVVPRPHRETSTRRVLSMDHVEGQHVDEWLATNPAQGERDDLGDRFFRATTRLFFGARLCWGDPHPGNLLVTPSGDLALLDFGSCRAFDAAEWELMRAGADAYRAGEDELRAVMIRGCDLSPKQAADPDRMRYLLDYANWMWEPMAAGDEPFDFRDPAYIQRGMALFGEASSKRYTRALPVNLYNARFLYGARVLCHRLGARVQAGRIMCEELERAGL